MNEHIKRLALLCGAWTQVYPNRFGRKDMMVDNNFDYEKFAELIVNECIRKINDDVIVFSKNDTDTKKLCIEIIAEHFGVKNEI